MPGIKPGMTENLVLMPRVECGLLRGRGFLLVLRLPLLIGHAVDLLTALVLSERNTLVVGGFLHPVAEAIAAQAREIHQVDVLHLGARTQMLDEAAEHRGVEFGLGFFVESHEAILYYFHWGIWGCNDCQHNPACTAREGGRSPGVSMHLRPPTSDKARKRLR